MSIEAVLVAIFFLVLPLIEMFRTAAARRKEQALPESPRKRLVSQGQPPRTMQAQIPPGLVSGPDVADPAARPDVPLIAAPDPVTVAVRERVSDSIAARIPTTRSAAGSLRDTAARHEASTTRRVIRGLRRPGGVHRAVVAMAILGPCRAVDSHDGREGDTRF